VIDGLMQAASLRVSGIPRFAAKAYGTREIVSRLVDEPVHRYTWADCELRAREAAQALGRMGMGFGDRATSLTWNMGRTCLSQTRLEGRSRQMRMAAFGRCKESRECPK